MFPRFYFQFVAVVLCTVFSPLYTYAQFKNPLGDITLFDFLLKILNAVVFILFPVVVLMIVYTGFLFVVAQGNESKITQARTALFWTVIGVLVLLGSKALSIAICETVKSIDGTTTVSCPK